MLEWHDSKNSQSTTRGSRTLYEKGQNSTGMHIANGFPEELPFDQGLDHLVQYLHVGGGIVFCGKNWGVCMTKFSLKHFKRNKTAKKKKKEKKRKQNKNTMI